MSIFLNFGSVYTGFSFAKKNIAPEMKGLFDTFTEQEKITS